MWFTNDPLPIVAVHAGRKASVSGAWMPSLLHHLSRTPGIHVDVVSAHRGTDYHFQAEEVDYFVISQPRFQSFFSCTKRDLEKCLALVRERDPDLIHVHGTERFYGLISARKLTPKPSVISLQGLLGACIPNFFGALSVRDLWRSERLVELATRRGLLWRYRDYLLGAGREREILAGAKAFMGRTEWDRAQLKSINPGAKYYHVDEILRDEFEESRWDVSECERHSIIFTNAGEPRRGVEILLCALVLIRRNFPNAKVRLAGGTGNRAGYHRFVRRMIDESGLSNSVELLGDLDASAMVKELSRAHVFATSSYIENSTNSLCEAMQVGLPCVATYVGGIPSLVEDGQTGLLFPAGDAPLLAEAIMRIFRDDDLARVLGQSARAEASRRHAPERVVSQLLEAYQDVTRNGDTVRQKPVAVTV